MRKTILLAVALVASGAAFGQNYLNKMVDEDSKRSGAILSDLGDDFDYDTSADTVPYLFVGLDTINKKTEIVFDFQNIKRITKRDSVSLSFYDSKTVTVLKYKKTNLSKKMLKTSLEAEDINHLKSKGIEYIMFNDIKFTFNDDNHLIIERANEVF